jgi:Fe-S oxidoreductase
MITTGDRVSEFSRYLRERPLDDEKRDYTDSEKLARVRRVFNTYFDNGMAVDLETCINCGMCADACQFYEVSNDPHYAPVNKTALVRRHYRRELSPTRMLFRPFTRRISVRDLEDWSKLVFGACTDCSRCDMMCPMGIRISRMIRLTRKALFDAGVVPAELESVEREQRDHNKVFGVDAGFLADCVAELRQGGLEIPVDKERADVMVLTTALDLKVFPGELAAYAKILNKLGVDWTLRSAAFEGSNFGLISGDTRGEAVECSRVVEEATAIGAKVVLTPDRGHAYLALRWEAANVRKRPLAFAVLSMPEFLAREIRSGRLSLNKAENGRSALFHDPCRLGRQSGVYDEPREIIASLGLELRRSDAEQREEYCCGGGCGEFVLQDYADLRQKVFALHQREADERGVDMVITACSACRFNFVAGADRAKWNKPIVSLTELVAEQLRA